MQQAELSAKREPRPIQAVKELVIRGSADVFVKRGEPSMTVIANNPEDVITEIRGGILSISTRPTVTMGSGRMTGVVNGSFHIGSILGGNVTINHGHVRDADAGALQMVYGQQVTVEITLPELTAASIEGSGDLILEELRQDEIELAITGSGTIRATGQVHLLVAAISGSGDVKAKDLMASIAELRISGSGDIKAQVSQSLTARVSGSGDIKVWGNPAKRDTKVSGSGDIRFK